MRSPSDTPIDLGSPTLRLTAWTLIVLFTAIFLGSIVGRTEIVARGKGRLVVVGRTQSIQPQLRGKVLQILVRDGDPVAAGDVLVRLDQTDIKGELDRLEVEITRQRRGRAMAQAVLDALASSDPSAVDFTETGVRRFREIAPKEAPPDGERSEALTRSILQMLHEQVIEVDAEIAQASAATMTQEERARKAEADEQIVALRNASAEELERHGVISHVTFLDRDRETRAAEADLQIAQRQREEMRSNVELARDRRRRLIAQAEADYRKTRSDAEADLRRALADRSIALNHLEETLIRSPLDGRVNGLKVFTEGGFVDAGQLLMSVVPVDQRLEFDAYFENRDAGFLEEGQQVLIKLDTFPSERFGYVTGRVLAVGADAQKIDEAPGWFYTARITLDRDHVQRDGHSYSFAPGMTGTADVITGERRLIGYFFEPIVKAIQDGLGER